MVTVAHSRHVVIMTLTQGGRRWRFGWWICHRDQSFSEASTRQSSAFIPLIDHPGMSSIYERTASTIISKNPSRHICDVTGAGSTLNVFIERRCKLQSFHRRLFRAIPCLAAEDAISFLLSKPQQYALRGRNCLKDNLCHVLDALDCSSRKHFGFDRS